MNTKLIQWVGIMLVSLLCSLTRAVQVPYVGPTRKVANLAMAPVVDTTKVNIST